MATITTKALVIGAIMNRFEDPDARKMLMLPVTASEVMKYMSEMQTRDPSLSFETQYASDVNDFFQDNFQMFQFNGMDTVRNEEDTYDLRVYSLWVGEGNFDIADMITKLVTYLK